MKPLLRPLLALAAAAAAAGCSEPSQGPVQVSAIGGEPRLVDPNRLPLDPPSALLVASTAQGLVRFDAGGEIEPALAQRWVVSDDGLRYTFRLGSGEWPRGGRILAEQVAARLRSTIAANSRNPLKPILGAIDEIEAMTDDVLEISLKSPRPNFLQLLAQPELAILRAGEGSGPLRAERRADGGLALLPIRPSDEGDEEEPGVPGTLVRGESAALAVARFDTGEADLVLGGTIADLPLARRHRQGANALRFDPVAGLFGLAFTRGDGPFASADLRQALAMAIDRPALVARFAVPGLQARESLLPPGIEGLSQVSAPSWILQPLAERRALASRLIAAAAPQRPLTVRVAMAAGPGHDLLFAQLRRDWATIGVSAEKVAPNAPADLRLIDEVAPAGLASWYLRHFSCEASRVCDPAADEMMAAARIAPDAATRRGLLANADRILAASGPFIPLAAPVRWSLVGPRLTGFRPNLFGRHPLDELVRTPD